MLEQNADATDSTTGGLVVLGGAAIQQTLWAGSNVHVDGLTHIVNTTDTEYTQVGVGALVVDGGVSIAKNMMASTVRTTDLTNAEDTNVASFIIDGGLGVGMDVVIGGDPTVRAHSSTT